MIVERLLIVLASFFGLIQAKEDRDSLIYAIDSDQHRAAHDWSNTNTAKRVWNEEEEQFQSIKYLGNWEHRQGEIHLVDSNSHYAFSSRIKSGLISIKENPFTDPLIISYEVRDPKGVWNCGGAYAKFLEGQWWPEKFNDQSDYAIMFGPDRCGAGVDQVHFIFTRIGNTNKRTVHRLKEPPKTKHTTLTVLYSLLIWPDDRFEIRIDGDTVRKGFLSGAEDFDPPVYEPPTIDDPTDTKPADPLIFEPMIPDPTAIEPPDWQGKDVPVLIPDPDAKKPSGWLEHVDPFIPADDGHGMIENPRCLEAPGCGPWEAPLIPYPAYKGPWKAPLIPNPHYRGPWKARQIVNTAYKPGPQPLAVEEIPSIGGVGFELWRVEGNLFLGNLIVTRDPVAYAEHLQSTWTTKRSAEIEEYKASLVDNKETIEEIKENITPFERLKNELNHFYSVSKSHPSIAIKTFPKLSILLALVSLAVSFFLARRLMTVKVEAKESQKQVGQQLTVLKSAVMVESEDEQPSQ